MLSFEYVMPFFLLYIFDVAKCPIGSAAPSFAGMDMVDITVSRVVGGCRFSCTTTTL